MTEYDEPGIGAPDRPTPAETTEPSLLGLANALLRNLRLVLIVPAVAVVLAVVIVLLQPRLFVAESRFVADSSNQGSLSLSGIAAQYGLNLGTGGGSGSPDFYVTLVGTRGLLRKTAATQYRVQVGGDTLEGTLPELLNAEGQSPEERLRWATGWLSQHVTAIAAPRTGVVTVRTMTPWRGLSIAVNRRIIDLVNEFDVNQRQQRAAQERRFREARLADAAQQLHSAEDTLEQFLERNRLGTTAPELAARLERLRREVQLRQQFYVSLMQSYEQARLEEVRTTPVISLMERPEDTARPAPRRLAIIVFLALLTGLVLGSVLALTAESIHRQARQHPEDADELRRRFARLWRTARSTRHTPRTPD